MFSVFCVWTVPWIFYCISLGRFSCFGILTAVLIVLFFILSVCLSVSTHCCVNKDYHFSVASSVLSVVCHIRAPCLNRWTDLDAIWQIHLWGLVGSNDPQGKGSLGRGIPQAQQTIAIANCCCHLANKNEERFRLSPNYFGLI